MDTPLTELCLASKSYLSSIDPSVPELTIRLSEEGHHPPSHPNHPTALSGAFRFAVAAGEGAIAVVAVLLIGAVCQIYPPVLQNALSRVGIHVRNGGTAAVHLSREFSEVIYPVLICALALIFLRLHESATLTFDIRMDGFASTFAVAGLILIMALFCELCPQSLGDGLTLLGVCGGGIYEASMVRDLDTHLPEWRANMAGTTRQAIVTFCTAGLAYQLSRGFYIVALLHGVLLTTPLLFRASFVCLATAGITVATVLSLKPGLQVLQRYWWLTCYVSWPLYALLILTGATERPASDATWPAALGIPLIGTMLNESVSKHLSGVLMGNAITWACSPVESSIRFVSVIFTLVSTAVFCSKIADMHRFILKAECFEARLTNSQNQVTACLCSPLNAAGAGTLGTCTSQRAARRPA